MTEKEAQVQDAKVLASRQPHILNGSLQAAMAWTGDKASKTVSAKRHLLAISTMISKRMFASVALCRLNHHLHQRFPGRVQAKDFLVKYRYDEVQLKLRVKTSKALLGARQRSQRRRNSAAADNTKAKLLQTSVQWSALWCISNEQNDAQDTSDSGNQQGHCHSVQMTINVPATIQCLEKGDAPHIREGIRRNIALPSFVYQDLSRIGLVPVCDSAAPNEVADSSLWRDAWPDVCDFVKMRCTVHREWKVGRLIHQPYSADVRGMLHACLSLSWAGRFDSLRSAMKKHMRKHLTVYRGHAGLAAEAYRESVCKKFTNSWDWEACPTNVDCKHAVRTHAVKQLLNGEWRRTGVWEHYCSGPNCCESPAATASKIEEHIIDCLQHPSIWCESRFMGIDVVTDFFGFWLLCHSILEDVYILFADSDSANTATETGDDDGNNAAAPR